MEAECLLKVASQVQSTAVHFRDQLNDCRNRMHELSLLQHEFRTTVRHLLRKMDKENIFQPITSFAQDKPSCTVTLASSETQTCDFPPPTRRWNSDLSLDLDGKSNGKRYHHRADRSELNSCLSTEAMMAPPIIRVPSAPKSKSASAKSSKFTNRLEVVNALGGKRPADNMLLSDLGLTSQAPEFSQSEFNLNREEHWMKEGQGKTTGGRVRFLSQDDGQGIMNMADEEEDLEGMNELPQGQVFHSQSASWATLTHSERDLSELDSSLSLNYQDQTGDNKQGFASSTPYAKGLRSKFKQSVSFHDLLPSKATQSMPNLPKQHSSMVETTSTSSARRTLALSSNTDRPERGSSPAAKRHSLTTFMEQRSQSLSNTRRFSLTGDLENGPYVPSAISSLFLGGRVKALHGGHLVVTGIVWYRGRLPGINEDVVGIELDQVGLGGDGTFQGHRYFRCAPGRGLFVPFRKIIMAWPTNSNQ